MYSYKIGISSEEHDEFVKKSSQTNLLQSSDWAKIKDNWGNERLGVYKDQELVAVASILIQPFHLVLPCSIFHVDRLWTTKTRT